MKTIEFRIEEENGRLMEVTARKSLLGKGNGDKRGTVNLL
jgi:hypothetical protein